jgi:hypothetical protein
MTKPKTKTKPAAAKAVKPKAHAAAPSVVAAHEQPAPGGKFGVMVNLLRRPGGATIHDLVTATGWQQHSIRGAFVGLKKRGFAVDSTKGEGLRTYFIPMARPPKKAPKAPAAKKKAAAR